MRDFFRGWKRKAGCVTLVTACLLMAGWVRSLGNAELIGVPLVGDGALIIVSGYGYLWVGTGPEIGSRPSIEALTASATQEFS